MLSADVTIHATQDLIYALQNPSPEIPLVKLWNSHKEALKSLVEIFRKAIPNECIRAGNSGGHSKKNSNRWTKKEPKRKQYPNQIH